MKVAEFGTRNASRAEASHPWRWAALGVGDVVLGVIGLIGWIVATTPQPSVGGGLPELWQPGGLGLLVVAYCGLVVVAGLRLAIGARGRWLGWLQLSLAAVLAVPAYFALVGPAGGGDPTFFGATLTICAAFVVASLWSGSLLLRSNATQHSIRGVGTAGRRAQ